MIKHGILYITWGVEDIISQAEEDDIPLTEEQGAAVLKFLDDHHDCNIGITWEVISSAIKYLFGDKK